MLYSQKTQEEILASLLSNLGGQYDKTAGYLPFDMAAALAIELAGIGAEQAAILLNGFGQTATGAYLDLHAGEFDESRKAATKATGSVTFTGTNGTVVPMGSLVSTRGGIQYQTKAAATIATGTAVVAIEASVAGANGNVPMLAIDTMPITIGGITAVSNPDETIGGTDTETDASLRARLLERVRLPATSGNAAHYIIWAKKVAGVGAAKVIPIWNGPGTVKVVIIDSNKLPASGAIISAVSTYVETQRPIGPTVTYVSATALNITVSATLVLKSGYTVAGLKPAIEAAITAYLASIAFVKTAVSYAQIGVAILSVEGVVDFSNLLVNTGTSNVAIGDTQVAVKSIVTLS